MTAALSPAAFLLPPPELARALIGCELLVDGVGGVIVETEAYDRDDPASHSRSGPTARNAAMFGPPGHAYVYRSHGLHWCLNLVCGPQVGGAVLLRAITPLRAVETMRARRGVHPDRLLCAGPGRLCQALAVTREHDSLPMDAPPFELRARQDEPPIAQGPRIGLSRAAETPWRFVWRGSAYLSRPMPL